MTKEIITKNDGYGGIDYYIEINRSILLLKCFLYKNHCYSNFIKNGIIRFNKINIPLKTLKDIIYEVLNNYGGLGRFTNGIQYLAIDKIINFSFSWRDSKEGDKYWLNIQILLREFIYKWIRNEID